MRSIAIFKRWSESSIALTCDVLSFFCTETASSMLVVEGDALIGKESTFTRGVRFEAGLRKGNKDAPRGRGEEEGGMEM